MRSWCKEFGKQRKMEIDFKRHDLQRLPQEISLGLFRVLQEALHYAAKHSGVKRVELQLAKTQVRFISSSVIEARDLTSK